MLEIQRLEQSQPARAAKLYLSLANRHHQLGQLERAFRLRGRALDLARLSGDAELTATCLFEAARSDAALGQSERAQKRWERCLELYHHAGDSWGESQALVQLGNLFYRAGRNRTASRLYQKAGKILEGLPGDPRTPAARAALLVNQANLKVQEEPRSALALYQMAQEQLRDPSIELNLAATLLELGQHQWALELMESAAAEYRRSGETSGELRAVLNLASLHFRLGAPRRSLDLLSSMLDRLPLEAELPRELESRLALSMSRLVKEPQERKRWLNKARSQMGAKLLPELSLALVELEFQEGDLKAVERTLTALRSDPRQPLLNGRLALAWGRLALERRRPTRAIQHYSQALKIAADSPAFANLAWRARAGLGRSLALSDPKLALSHYRQALAALDRVQGQLRSDELRTTFLEDKHPLYSGAIELMVKEGLIEEAFAVSERARARSLLESLRASGRLPTDLRPLTHQQIQGQLPNDTVLLSYWVGDKQTLRFRLDRNSLTCQNLPVTREELKEQVDQLRPALWYDGRQLPPFDEQASARLHTLLLSELELSVGERVVILADGPLHGLPFALLKKKRFLISDHPLVYGRSASLLVAASGRRGPLTRLSIYAAPEPPARNLPPLPFAAEEARLIAERFDSPVVRVGAAARESLFYQDQQQRDGQILHFATHAILNDRNPLSSGLVLASAHAPSDGVLTAGEIARLPLKAQLVVLSACNSGLGRHSGAEGLMGLTRAFQQAGATNVLASLWQVSDRSTATFMSEFYGALGKRQSLSEALRSAQISSLEGEHKHPFLWGSFTIMGPDW